MKKTILFSAFFCFAWQNCQSNELQMTNKQALFENCMETFSDEIRCQKLLQRSEEDLRTEAEQRKAQRERLTEEEKDGLKIRQVVKDTLQSQSKPFVKGYLGEPDKIEYGGDREYWVYTRPVARYSTKHDPDEEVTVIFRRNKVERVNHIKALTTPDSDMSFKKFLGNKEKDKTQAPNNPPTN